jgi:AraC-like DNA-binding protein/DNA-binding transcriptional ArsR family regulator
MQRGNVLPSVAGAWKLARAGSFRDAIDHARTFLGAPRRDTTAGKRIEMHLVAACCAMRQGQHAAALEELEAAQRAAAERNAPSRAPNRIDTWRAELAYFQGRYSAASEILDRVLPLLESSRDAGYAAFALRVRMAILLARADYDAIEAIGERALRHAERSGDDYVLVQVLNILGAMQFDRATSKLQQPHARAHLSALDMADLAPLEADARRALELFERAKGVAERGGYRFAAWYVAGNIERLEILLGRPQRAVTMIRKRLRALQAAGAAYDEIVTRSNLAWALRNLERHAEALHELDAALLLARKTGTHNVLLEFLHYDRSVVLDALGDTNAARASYRRYLRLNGAEPARAALPAAAARPPLEPYFLKRADRYIAEHLGVPAPMQEMARHCGVSWRTLEKAFAAFRGITPVAHVRNVRLDHARRALESGDESVREVAARFGFRSSTTFATEYRKRFGSTPSEMKRLAPA